MVWRLVDCERPFSSLHPLAAFLPRFVAQQPIAEAQQEEKGGRAEQRRNVAPRCADPHRMLREKAADVKLAPRFLLSIWSHSRRLHPLLAAA
jgi:hypothetical protein